VINELDFSRNGGDAEFTVTGLSIDADELEQAINDAFFDFGESLQAFLNGIGLQADLSAGQVGMKFQGLGGDDTVTMTNADDTYYVDGGTDLVSLGAGDDTVIAYAAFGFSAPGTVSIDGGAGTDILDLNPEGDGTYSVKHGVTVDLEAEVVDLGEDWQLAVTEFEGMRGTKFADELLGSKSADMIEAGGGGDMITGRGGADDLTGSKKAADEFIYIKKGDSAAGNGHDTIIGFEHNKDSIDLSGLSPANGAHAFIFKGEGPLKNAGDLHFILHDSKGTDNDFTMIEANLDGKGGPDLQIELEGLVHLSKGDFVL
jgi:Ca2+-binding RTX toxin-like protein